MTQTTPLISREQVVKALEEGGSVKSAAEILRVSRPTVYAYIKRFEIEYQRHIRAA